MFSWAQYYWLHIITHFIRSRFLRGDKYPEKEDICSVDSGNLEGPSRKYQFWLKCEKIELKKLFQEYILTDDEDKRLPEVGPVVQHCMSKEEEEKDMEHFLIKKDKDARNTEDFINSLKGRMEHDLQREFDKFREAIGKKYPK